MHRKEDILKKLNEDNYYIDLKSLENFIREWQIDAIYESHDGTEFFDETSILKIKKGISLKSQGYNKDQIQYRIHKALPEKIKEEQNIKEIEEQFEESTKLEVANSSVPEVRNVSLNITNQTLQMLAEAVAGKITDEIKTHIDTSQFSDKLIEAGSYKKDNEILSRQIETLINDNKNLSKRISELENKNKSFWRRLFG